MFNFIIAILHLIHKHQFRKFVSHNFKQFFKRQWIEYKFLMQNFQHVFHFKKYLKFKEITFEN